MSSIPAALWLIPLVVLASLAVLIWLTRRWRSQARQDLKARRSDLRRLEARFRALEAAGSGHSAEDAEPYGQRAALLHAQIEGARRLLSGLEISHVRLNERMAQLSANRFRLTLGAPYYWYQLSQETAALQPYLDGASEALAEAEQSAVSLHHTAWEVALEARQVLQLHEKTSNQLHQLEYKNLCGDALDDAKLQIELLHSALQRLPEPFFSASESEFSAQADKATVVEAHNLLHETRPALEAILAQGQAWEKLHAEAAEKTSRLRQYLQGLGNGLKDLPNSLEAVPLKARFDGLEVIARTLQSTLAHAEVENLEQILQETAKVDSAARELDAELRLARQQHAELEQALIELNADLKQLSASFAALGTHAIHPIAWGQSGAQLTALSRQTAALGSINRARTPEKLKEDLDTARRLVEQRKELAQRCDAAAVKHAELLALLESPELSQGQAWQQKAEKLLQQVDEYDPENWPKADNLASLPQGVSALGKSFELLAATERSASVGEAGLDQTAANLRELQQATRQMQAQLERVSRRLEEIQKTEDAAAIQADQVRVTLAGLAALARSNSLLDQAATTEIGRLQTSLQQLVETLAQRHSGTVDKKARAAAALHTRLAQDCNSWIKLLTREMEKEINGLIASLARLEAIAPLEEPAVAEARRLVNTVQALGAGTAASKVPLDLEGQVLEMKRRSETWQSCLAARRALADVEKTLLETHAAASEQRQYAIDQLSDLTTWLRSTQPWPPTAHNLDAERLELNRIEEQWKALKSEPTRAMPLVAQLGNLAARYQAVAEKARQVAERVARDYSQVEELERQLDEVGDLWQSQWQQQQANPQTVEAIRKLLGEMEQSREEIKRQYRRREKDYQEVFQALQALYKKVRQAQVPLDEAHVIDVSGRKIQFK